jgi:hypothetical protein
MLALRGLKGWVVFVYMECDLGTQLLISEAHFYPGAVVDCRLRLRLAIFDWTPGLLALT